MSQNKLQDITFILRDWLKVIKVVSIYPEGNPLPQSLRRTFAERLVDIVQDYGDIEISVDSDNLVWNHEVVFTDRSKEESLAGLLFDTGITKVVFKRNLEVNEVYRLLDAIKDFQNSYDRSKDLAACIWEAGLSGFTFQTVEDLALAEYDGDIRIQEFSEEAEHDIGKGQIASDQIENYNALFVADESDAPPRDESSGIYIENVGEDMVEESGGDFMLGDLFDIEDESEADRLEIVQAVKAMGLNDLPAPKRTLPDTAVIFSGELRLSDEEQQQLTRLIREDATFSPWESATDLIKEILNHESELQSFYESVTICDKLVNEFVQAGRLTYASSLLRYLAELEDNIRADKPLWAERLKESRVTAGSRERLNTLTETLNLQEEIGSLEVRRYLEVFDWQALMGVSEILDKLRHEVHRQAVSDYLAQKGKNNIGIIARALYDKRPSLICSAIPVMARVGDNTALGHLEKLITHEDREVRMALVTALEECTNDTAVDLLRRLASDRDAAIRKQAVQSIVARRGQPAFDAITEIINNDEFEFLDRDDQQDILIAYSKLGSDMAVEYLAGLVEKVNLLKDSKLSFYRQAALEALAHNQGDKAEKYLVKLASSWRMQLKTQATEALRRRRELLYGGDDGEDE